MTQIDSYVIEEDGRGHNNKRRRFTLGRAWRIRDGGKMWWDAGSRLV